MDALRQFFRDHPEYGDGVPKAYAVYTAQYAPLAASAVQSQADITIGNFDFIACGMKFSQTTANTNAAYINTPLLISIVWGALNRNITNVKVEGQALGEFPQSAGGAAEMWWPYPIVCPAATQLSTLVDNPLAVAANVFITFHGFNAPRQKTPNIGT